MADHYSSIGEELGMERLTTPTTHNRPALEAAWNIGSWLHGSRVHWRCAVDDARPTPTG